MIEPISLKKPKTENIRTGLYMPIPLKEEITKIAEEEETSFSGAMIQLAELGLERYRASRV